MSAQPDWHSLDLGPLTHVTELRVEDSMLVALRLHFGTRGVDFIADPNTDELRVREADGIALDAAASDVRNSPWLDLIGQAVSYGWRLTNHLGFEDGYELELLPPALEPRTVIRMIVEASQIRVMVVPDNV